MKKNFIKTVGLVFTVYFLYACSPTAPTSQVPVGSTTPFSISGNVTYDWIPAKDSVTEGGVRLDYAAKAARPVRRAVVQAVDSSGNVVVSSSTDDLGNYTLSSIPGGSSVQVRVLSKSTVTSYTPDTTAPNFCSGANWDVRVVNNFTNNASSLTNPALRSQYAVTDSTFRSAAATGVNLLAGLTYASGYTLRAAAPFAMLDTIITQIELVCQSEANATFAKLYVNWSDQNTNASGNLYAGQIGTSHYTTEDHTGESSVGNLYILGKENTDTDEYDDHVMAHEFGHYLESKLYRSDSRGGSHSLGDSLDARVAFGEGFGNALSAMTFNDAVYVDTAGANQASGFILNMATAPTGDDKGIYSERAVQNFLWNLYDARDGTANSGSYDRIHNIFKNFQKTTPALTTVASFSAYYVQVYDKASEGIETLFNNAFDVSVNALCSGVCPGTGAVADLFDTNNDFSAAYGATGSAPKNYKQTTGTTFATNFWNLYFPLANGANTDANHMQIHAGGYTAGTFSNKYGNNRWYLYNVAGATTTLKFVATIGGVCTADIMDMFVYKNGVIVAGDFTSTGATAGCPDSSAALGAPLTAAASDKIIVVIQGNTTTTTSFDITVTP
ncbi:MAG: hypothetical protein AABY53_01215 [Bdellovibrionota bacterium]